MKLLDNKDPKTHLAELNQHFQIMLQCHNNLVQMGSTISDTRFNIIIMSSLPELYQPTLQMITTAKCTSCLASRKTSVMKHNNLIAFILEEAQHRVINDKHTKTTETALATYTKKGKQNKAGKQKKSERNSTTNMEECDNTGIELQARVL